MNDSLNMVNILNLFCSDQLLEWVRKLRPVVSWGFVLHTFFPSCKLSYISILKFSKPQVCKVQLDPFLGRLCVRLRIPSFRRVIRKSIISLRLKRNEFENSPVRCTTKKVLGTEVQGYRYRKHLSQKKIESHYTRCDGTFSFLTTQRFIRTYRDESQKLTHLFWHTFEWWQKWTPCLFGFSDDVLAPQARPQRWLQRLWWTSHATRRT
jgi:hypothetical protein